VTYKLHVIITHKSFGTPVIKELYFQGDTFDDVLARIEAEHVPQHLMHNLRHHKRAAFKDARGVKHNWKLELQEHLN